jgi:predicted transcriptional regulator
VESKEPSLPSTLPVKTTLDRKAVERILARAAELQTQTPSDTTDAISEAQLMEIAKEVGLSEDTIKQALAEEQTRVEVDTNGTWLERVAGPKFVSATRTVTGTPEATLERLDAWMQHEEGLQIQRRYTTRIVWEPRQDWIGIIRRNLKSGGRSYQLTRSPAISGTVITVDDHRTLIRLDADVAASRSRHISTGVVFGASGMTISGVFAALGFILPPGLSLAAFSAALVPAPVAAYAMYLTMKHQQAFLIRTKVALERVLDQMEFPSVNKPTSLLTALTNRNVLR